MFVLTFLLVALFPSQSTDQWSKTFNVEGSARLRVKTGDANIHVTGGEAGGAIQARVLTQNWKIGEDGIQIFDRQSGNEVEIEVRFPQHWFNANFKHRRVDIELKVPRDIDLNLNTGDGNIDLRAISGDVVLRTGDGNLEIEDVDGKLDANTGDGGVRVARAKGEVTLQSGDGKIEVEGVDGALRVQTGDGPVRVSGRFDLLNVKTGDGRVEAMAQHGSRLASDWTLWTGDGGLTMRVPAELGADVELHTGDGKIELGVPVTIEGKADTRNIRGKLNAGGKLLTLRTGDGPIRLEKL
jgi:DUF4097 and DUF4098 domain-containing protein YvlB